jgi:uncharacterized protein
LKAITFILILLPALACPAFSEDIQTLIKKAEGGSPEVQFNLGVAYGKGEGVPQDYLLAYIWWSLATTRTTDEGYDRCANYRDRAAKQLTPEQLTNAQQMIREWEEMHQRK